jgi:hypothetical protein
MMNLEFPADRFEIDFENQKVNSEPGSQILRKNGIIQATVGILMMQIRFVSEVLCTF